MMPTGDVQPQTKAEFRGKPPGDARGGMHNPKPRLNLRGNPQVMPRGDAQAQT